MNRNTIFYKIISCRELLEIASLDILTNTLLNPRIFIRDLEMNRTLLLKILQKMVSEDREVQVRQSISALKKYLHTQDFSCQRQYIDDLLCTVTEDTFDNTKAKMIIKRHLDVSFPVVLRYDLARKLVEKDLFSSEERRSLLSFQGISSKNLSTGEFRVLPSVMDARGKQKPRACREDESSLKEKFLELKDDLRAGRMAFATEKLLMIAGSYHLEIQKSPWSLGKYFRYLSNTYPAIKEMTDISSEHKRDFLLVLKITAITMLRDYRHLVSKLNRKGVEDLANGIACFFEEDSAQQYRIKEVFMRTLCPKGPKQLPITILQAILETYVDHFDVEEFESISADQRQFFNEFLVESLEVMTANQVSSRELLIPLKVAATQLGISLEMQDFIQDRDLLERYLGVLVDTKDIMDLYLDDESSQFNILKASLYFFMEIESSEKVRKDVAPKFLKLFVDSAIPFLEELKVDKYRRYRDDYLMDDARQFLEKYCVDLPLKAYLRVAKMRVYTESLTDEFCKAYEEQLISCEDAAIWSREKTLLSSFMDELRSKDFVKDGWSSLMSLKRVYESVEVFYLRKYFEGGLFEFQRGGCLTENFKLNSCAQLLVKELQLVIRKGGEGSDLLKLAFEGLRLNRDVTIRGLEEKTDNQANCFLFLKMIIDQTKVEEMSEKLWHYFYESTDKPEKRDLKGLLAVQLLKECPQNIYLLKLNFSDEELDYHRKQHQNLERGIVDSALGPSLGPSPVVTQQFGPSQGQALQPIDAEEDAGDA